MSLDRSFNATPKHAESLSPAHWVTIYTLAVAIAPPVFAYLSGGLASIFRYLAADSFVYLAVAANSQAGFYTFDGTHPTNGFHPLWQYGLQALTQAFGLASDKTQQIQASFWLSVGLVTVAGVLIAQAARRVSGSVAVACLMFPGIFGMAMLLGGWPAGTMWSFMNGMETPCSLLFFGMLLFHLSRPETAAGWSRPAPDRINLLILSALSAGLVLSRLDDVFLPAIIGLSLLATGGRPIRQRVEAALWFGLPLTLVIGGYLLFNAVTVGTAMPISGAAKFDLRTPLINIGLFGSSLHALVPDFLYDPFSGNGGDVTIASVNWRNAQMLGPVIVARILLSRVGRLGADGKADFFAYWMRLMLIYVMVKGAYNFLFVPLLHQGNWYYPLSITIINLAAAMLAVRAWTAWTARHLRLRRIGIPVTMAVGLLGLVLFTYERRAPDSENRYHALFERGPAIKARLIDSLGSPRIIEADDGIVNYAVGLPTMSGFLFAIDPDGYAAYRRGDFLSEASRRGYQLIGSLYYLRSATPDDLTPQRIPATLREKLFNGTDWDLDRFDFALEYRDDETGAVFIRFTPKQDGAG
jgi:hypothetical protein